ncbi:MAG: chemotaxis protein CheW [Thermodesulfobacteriota bacterium]
MSSYTDKGTQAFREEALELLDDLEDSLLELESDPGNDDLINRVFRAMHTIKGSGAMFGFDDISTFTHEVETVFDLVRGGQIKADADLINLTFSARDLILDMLEGEEDESGEQAREIIAALRELTGDSKQEAPQEEEVVEEKPGPQPDDKIFRILFTPSREIFLTGSDPVSLLDELGDLGECRFLMYEEVPDLEDFNPELCYLRWDIVLTSSHGEDAVKDVFIFLDEDEFRIQEISEFDDSEDYKKIGQILIERGDISAEEVQTILRAQKPLGKMLVEAGVINEKQVQAALEEQKIGRELGKARQRTESISTAASNIRVSADKLDHLVDLAGQLVIIQSRLSQEAFHNKGQALGNIAEELERLSDEMRDSTLGIRMLPIGTTFGKFRRLVRDLSQDMGKEIELTTEGAETELDKTVIEKLNDPLVHLLRNSIDHGIELPDQRTKAGKPKCGTVKLSASHSGGNVLVEIEDDGKGMDPNKLREKAVASGIVSSTQELTDQDALELIFHPGFSMAEKVSDVSGRGVGMDVVKRNIESLRGRIDIESKLGEGSKISVKIPLTLAIIDGLQVQVENDFYILPLSIVEECVETRRAGDENQGREVIRIREELVPFIALRGCFSIEGDMPEIEQVVVTNTDAGRVGIVVDKVIGEHQTVIKSLGHMYKDVPGISGATIKGDGSMALILDIAHLIKHLHAKVV